jgi:hypothetical protein
MSPRPVLADFPDVAPLVSSLRRNDSGEAIWERSSSSGSKPIPISLKTDLRRRLGGVVAKDLLKGSPTDTGGSLGLPILIMMTYAEAIDDELKAPLKSLVGRNYSDTRIRMPWHRNGP